MAATTRKVRLGEEARTIELTVPEDAEIPSGEDDAIIILVIKNTVGVFSAPRHTYDWVDR
jgi:hypothetical protein